MIEKSLFTNRVIKLIRIKIKTERKFQFIQNKIQSKIKNKKPIWIWFTILQYKYSPNYDAIDTLQWDVYLTQYIDISDKENKKW